MIVKLIGEFYLPLHPGTQSNEGSRILIAKTWMVEGKLLPHTVLLNLWNQLTTWVNSIQAKFSLKSLISGSLSFSLGISTNQISPAAIWLWLKYRGKDTACVPDQHMIVQRFTQKQVDSSLFKNQALIS